MQTTETTNGNLHSAAPGLLAKSRGTLSEACAVDAKITAIIGNEYPKTVIELLRTAQRSIDIAAYTWKWYEHQANSAMQRINYAVIEKARHGVKVRARFNHEHKDHCLTKENTRTAQALRRYKVETRFDGTEVMSHLKLIIIDNEIAILGSHNLSARSVTQNNETSIVIFGRESVKRFVNYFDLLWTKQL